MREYVGAVHIHSDYSDGTKSIPEIARIAQSVDLDFLLFADHMTLQPLHDGHEGWHDRVLVLIGYEINDPDNKNHYLAFDVKEVLHADLSAPEYVRAIHAQQGLGFIAHPDEIRHAFDKYPPYPWTHWEAVGFDGIEIWNHMSEWMEGLTKANRLKMILSPRKLLKGPTQITLQRWDELNAQRRVVGIGAIDVHAYPYRLGPFTIIIFPYKVQFQSIRTHLLVPEPLSHDLEKDKQVVYRTLRTGTLFVSNFRWGDARGFRFWAEDGQGEVQMGQSVHCVKGIDLWARVPTACQIYLVRGGQRIAGSFGRELFHRTDLPGAYRIEVFRGKHSWIYSNHIRLTSEVPEDGEKSLDTEAI
jgi:predicted metal-dependent phosphoesterase TrpH